MKIELTPDAEQWVKAEVLAGTFATPEDAVRHAINHAKQMALRTKLAAAIAEGGENTADEVREHVRQHLDRLQQTPKAS